MKSITYLNAGNLRKKKQHQSRTRATKSRSVAQDNVLDLTNSTAFALHKLKHEIERTPVIVTNRRNNIRNAIINGHYVANPRKIASKIIDMELNLFKKN